MASESLLSLAKESGFSLQSEFAEHNFCLKLKGYLKQPCLIFADDLYKATPITTTTNPERFCSQ